MHPMSPDQPAQDPQHPSNMGVVVELNVYDLLHPDNPDALPTLNSYLYSMGMGLYHSGVSVYGTEYCFGGHPHASTGVFAVAPKNAPDARFRQTLLVGRTHLTPLQVRQLIRDISAVWTGNSYNLLTRCVSPTPFQLSRTKTKKENKSSLTPLPPTTSVLYYIETVTISQAISANALQAPQLQSG